MTHHQRKVAVLENRDDLKNEDNHKNEDDLTKHDGPKNREDTKKGSYPEIKTTKK